MGLLKLLGLSTQHEGQHRPGKHKKDAVKKPVVPKKGKGK